MRTQLSTIALLAFLALLVFVAARPNKYSQGTWHRMVDLSAAVNKTVCPIKVVLNAEKGRVPYIIKTIECETGKVRHCCHSHTSGVRAYCTQLRDDVLVYYPDGAPGHLVNVKTMKISVAVGCVCMMHEFSEGMTTPDPNYLR